MKMGYVITGKYMGESWESEIFEDAEEFDQAYYDYSHTEDFTVLKKQRAYIHYEEMQDDES